MTLKTIIVLTAALLTSIAGFARTYSPEDVPNVHIQDKTQFVADPESYLSNSTTEHINNTLATLRQTTTAEPMVVIISNVPDADIDNFATDLFQLWGLGKADKDNGLLIAVAIDDRKAVIRTGYGLEGTLPDITCGRILREIMFPKFADGDYDAGLSDAIDKITQLLSDPQAAAEFASSLPDADNDTGSDSSDEAKKFLFFYLTISGLITLFAITFILYRLHTLRGKNDYEKYIALESLRPALLIFTFLGLGLPIIASVPLVILLRHWRDKPRRCPNCSTAMQKIDEVHDNDYLSPAQDLEERIGSIDYDVWKCPCCNETDILPYINRNSAYKECPQCHARTMKLHVTRVIKQPTARAYGLGERLYICQNCNHNHHENFKIEPTDDDSATLAALGGISVVAGRSGIGGGHSGGSFGGGFGGGFTGGGGASGGW